MNDSPEHLMIAQELDRMDRDVTSWEADFLESVLTALKNGHALSVKQIAKLNQMHEKYLGVGAVPEPDEGDEE